MEDEVVYNGWLKVCKRKVNDRIYIKRMHKSY